MTRSSGTPVGPGFRHGEAEALAMLAQGLSDEALSTALDEAESDSMAADLSEYGRDWASGMWMVFLMEDADREGRAVIMTASG